MGRGSKAALLAVLLAALAAAPARAATNWPVTFACCQYMPSSLSIAVGDTVTFTATANASFYQHPLVWDSGDYATNTSATPNGSAPYGPFTVAGTYAFHCQIHQSLGMVGTIKVGDDQHAMPDFSTSPASPQAGQGVTFTYTGGADPDGSIVRWDWDLDGDGTFETHTTQGTVTRAYDTARAITIQLRVVDNGHEASATVAHGLTVTAAPGPGGGGGGTPAPGGSTFDTTSPHVSLSTLRVPRLARFLFAGLRITFASGERGRAEGRLRAGGITLARDARLVPLAGVQNLILRPTRAGRHRLRRLRTGARLRATLTLVVTDAAGNATTVVRHVVLRR